MPLEKIRKKGDLQSKFQARGRGTAVVLAHLGPPCAHKSHTPGPRRVFVFDLKSGFDFFEAQMVVNSRPASIFSMSNKWILLAYAVLFFAVISSYESYSDNTYLVALAGVTLSFAGVGAWVWSAQPKRGKD